MDFGDELFRPRDFIYINKIKLNSYFSQLFGGLVENMGFDESQENVNKYLLKLSGEGLAKFGLGNSSSSLINFICNRIGNFEASLKANIHGQTDRQNKESSTITSTRTLEHFQYALFEQSLTKLDYLIDLDNFIENNRKTDAGTIRGKLSATDFIKFKATNIIMSDYRNASELVHLIKRIIDFIAEVKLGEHLDNYPDQIKEIGTQLLKIKSFAMVANLFSADESNNLSLAQGKMVEVIVNAIDEAFRGSLLPLDVLLISSISLDNRGILTFESLLKDEFFLEERTDISFKYGYFEDANWTIIGQVTSLNAPGAQNVVETLESLTEDIEVHVKDPNNIDREVNTFSDSLLSHF
jgi:hypothetical protein